MSTKKSETYQRLNSEDQPPPFEHIVIVEENETDHFIQETLMKNIGLAGKIEVKKSAQEVLFALVSAKKLTEIPDLILLSFQAKSEPGNNFLEKFAELPDLVRARCKLIIVTGNNTKEEKQRAIMNPSVIRYLEKPLDANNFRDFLFM